MKIQHASSASEQEAIWRESLTQGHVALKGLRKLMHLLPGTPRCKVCHNPFGGFGGHVCRAIGMTPSRKNPQLCALCCEKLPPGGAEVETAILFADVRGSTALADRLGPAKFAATMNRFYRMATDTLMRHEATIDKFIGDEVMAFFVPGFAGPDFKHRAIAAGQALLRGVGYGSAQGAWLPLGVGIDAGIAFVGNVGAAGYLDFTALGDPVNTAARIQAAAQPGELLVGEAAFASVADRYPGCEASLLEVKGKDAALRVFALPLRAAT
jgi:adenylate cyclase